MIEYKIIKFFPRLQIAAFRNINGETYALGFECYYGKGFIKRLEMWLANLYTAMERSTKEQHIKQTLH